MIPEKEDPARLALRARPRPVTRLSRQALVTVSVLACLGVAAASWYALGPGSLFRRGDTAPELFNTENKPQADGLSSLPKSYADLPKPKPVPQLGPPLPGDLGRPMLQAAPGLAGRDVDADAAHRRRITEAEQAATAKVFFQVSAHPAGKGASAPSNPAVTPPEAEASAPPLDADSAQNLQDRKQAFLDRRVSAEITSPQRLQTPRSPYQLMAGTVVAAALVTGIDSDLPGQIVGQVTENVYDSFTGRFLLMPQGTRLIGKYDSVVAYGQERVLLVWTRAIMPDGSSIGLDNLPGTDAEGYAGLEDGVDYHTWRLIKGVALSTLLGVSSELAANGNSQTAGSGNITLALRQSADNTANQVGQRIVSKDLAIQPSLTVRPGFPLRIIVNRDIALRPYRS